MEAQKNHSGWQRVLGIFVPYVLVVGIFQVIGALIMGVDIDNIEAVRTSFQILILLVLNLIGSIVVIGLFMRYVDEDKFISLGFQFKNRLKDFLLGFGLGAFLIILGFVILLSVGEFTVKELVLDVNELLISVLIFILVAIGEELLIRGYVLRNLMISFNKYIALIVSSVLFSLMHIFNSNIDFFALSELFIAGLLLGISYVHTKNLWFPIGLHLSWNLFQSLLGFNVSGEDMYSIIELELIESNRINGGAFGFEGSILSMLFSVVCIVIIHRYCKNIIKNTSVLEV